MFFFFAFSFQRSVRFDLCQITIAYSHSSPIFCKSFVSYYFPHSYPLPLCSHLFPSLARIRVQTNEHRLFPPPFCFKRSDSSGNVTVLSTYLRPASSRISLIFPPKDSDSRCAAALETIRFVPFSRLFSFWSETWRGSHRISQSARLFSIFISLYISSPRRSLYFARLTTRDLSHFSPANCVIPIGSRVRNVGTNRGFCWFLEQSSSNFHSFFSSTSVTVSLPFKGSESIFHFIQIRFL